MEDPLSQLDDRELSLFTTPLGRVVQQEYVQIVLSKK